MKIPQKVKDLFERIPLIAFGTADNKGYPNVNVIFWKKILDDENEGWQAENYFASQDTFFYKEELQLPYARCTCRRWINKK